MIIRPGVPSDASRIAAIHAAALPLPWSLAAVRQLLAEETAVVLVAETDAGETAGFLTARDTYDGFELLNLAVLPACRRAGLATALIAALIRSLPSGCRTVYLEVRETNAAARTLYTACGFRVLARRERYYPDTNEAALLMALDTAGPTEP